MTLDSKYATYQGIPCGQPDVYETSDLPEVDQAFTSNYTEDASDNIDNSSIKIKDATQHFKDKDLKTDGKTDFSDLMYKESMRKRRQDDEDEEEEDEDQETSGKSRRAESIVDRYERVMREIAKLKEDLVNGGDQPASPDQPITLSQLRELVGALETQVVQHKLDQVLGSNAKGLSLDAEASVSSALKTQMTRLQSDDKPSKTSVKPAANENAKSSVVYELFHSEEVEKVQNLEKLTALNDRMSRLERVVGSGLEASKLSAMTAGTAHKGLLEASGKMLQAAALLDGPQLDQLESRLTALTNRLGQMAERRETEMDSDTQNRVAALYTLVKQHEKIIEALPGMIDRVTALKALHKDALNFSQSLSQLDSRQQILLMTVRSHCQILQKIEEGMSGNVEIIRRNEESMSERLKALGQ